jgi:hypothetical protein
MLNTCMDSRTVWPYRSDCPQSRRSAVAALTVHACVESVRVPDFLWSLLAKPAGLTRETTCNGSRPPIYIDEGLRPIEPPKIDPTTLVIVLPYALGVALV